MYSEISKILVRSTSTLVTYRPRGAVEIDSALGARVDRCATAPSSISNDLGNESWALRSRATVKNDLAATSSDFERLLDSVSRWPPRAERPGRDQQATAAA